jgi:hypothetical protein
VEEIGAGEGVGRGAKGGGGIEEGRWREGRYKGRRGRSRMSGGELFIAASIFKEHR